MTMRLFLLPLILVTLLPKHLCADDQVRSVQEELRRRKLYFGDVDGRETSEVDEAVKRYQKKKGLNTAGVRDTETLRSLGLAGRGEAPNWPDEPVLRSDLTINVAEAAEEIAQESGVEPASIVGEKLAETDPSSRLTARGKPRLLTRPQQASARQGAGGDGTRNLSIAPEGIRGFLRDFLEATEGKKLREELRFYADHLTYYNNGLIDRRVVERALLRYHDRWPHRRYRQGKGVQYAFDAQRAEITVIYQVTFTLKGHGKKVKGTTVNRMVINAATSDPRIVSIQERRAR